MSGLPSGMKALHADVLNAKPSDEAATAALVVELKSRGNAAFKAKRVPEAEFLYAKAVEWDPKNQALQSNHSMALAMLGKFEEALAAADKCTALDKSWPKGHFRRGQALQGLKKFDDAIAAFELAGTKAPGDDKLRKQVDKAVKGCIKAQKKAAELVEREAKRAKKVQQAAPADWAPATATANSEGAATTTKTTKKKKAGDMRGYKKTADGKTTSYFHRDISVEAKELIGDIAPKAVSAEQAAKLHAEMSKDSGAASSWNKGGTTYEERDVSKLAKKMLHEQLVGSPLTIDVPGESKLEGAALSVTKLDGVEGDGSCPVIRGARRHLFEFAFKVHWECVFQDDAVATQKGTIEYTEVCNDSEGDYGVQVKISTHPDEQARRLVMEGLSTSAQGLRGQIAKRIDEFTAAFMEI